MNQTQKRLNIIKLAISIGDNETIQLQLLKLAPLKTDEKIQEIIRGLQAENFAQTLPLITEYIETPPEEILQRASQEASSPQDDEAIIEEFDLFRTTQDEADETENDLFDLETETADTKKDVSENDFDSLLALTSDDVLTDSPDIPQTLPRKDEDDFFSADQNNTTYNYTEVIGQDDFFQTDTTDERDSDEEEPLSPVEPESAHSEEESEAAPASAVTESKEEPLAYDPIPYIDQKLRTMQTQYPPVEEPESSYPAVDAWLIKISKEGYTETEVEETIAYIQQLKERGENAQAAQLLLVSAATQSKYAQFMLARALFKGDILQKNLPESFTLINRLAMDDDYPEAICDLGQLYEYGIGIEKDKQRAEELYQEAMDLGIKRAAEHYERVHQENKGLLGRLFGK